VKPIPETRAERVLIYSHDTYGLGHLRRSLAIAERLLRGAPRRSVLIATGSPRAPSFDTTPGCDLLKLPCVLKQPDGGYAARTLRTDVADLAALRSALLRTAAAAFAPDLVLVDHSPLGWRGELLPMFEDLARAPRRPRLVLGLRDVVDDAETVRACWMKEGVWPRIDGLYDRVLVYGDPTVTATAQELGLVDRLGDRLTFTGYLGRPLPRIPSTDPRPMVLVTTGGGGDGGQVLRAAAAYLESNPRPDLRFTAVAGPFLSPDRAEELSRRFAAAGAAVDFRGFAPDMDRLWGEARAAIAMAGYNSAVEALSARTPTLFIPRTAPRLEQALRAERLAAAAPCLETLRVEQATPAAIGAFLDRALATSHECCCPRFALDGLDRTAQACEEELARGAATRARPVGATSGVGR